jgi:anti-sigma factor RsiW
MKSQKSRNHPITKSRDSAADCRKLISRLSEFLDGELKPAMCAKISRHADRCPPCKRFIASLRATVRLCRKTGAPRLSAAAKLKLRRHIMKLTSRPAR